MFHTKKTDFVKTDPTTNKDWSAFKNDNKSEISMDNGEINALPIMQEKVTSPANQLD